MSRADNVPPVKTIPQMREFVGEMCFVLGIRGDAAPVQAVVSMPRSDLEALITIRNFFDRIEPYADDIREIVRRGTGRAA